MVPRFAVLLILALSATVLTAVPKRIPPLIEPATNVQLPGKFVWADIFSTDPNSTARFYGALFDLTSRTYTDEGGKYVVLGSTNGPVVGVVRGPDRKDKRPSARWVSYISSSDLASAASSIEAGGGRVIAGPRVVPDRGDHLLALDAEGALFGMMDSTAGDPVDDKAKVGELVWFNLFAHDPEGAATFYGAVGGLDSEPYRSEGLILSAHGLNRAGVSQLDDETTVSPTWVPFFKVVDIDRKLKVARRLGAKVVVEKRTLESGSQIAILSDTFGGVFAVVEIEDQPEESS